MNFFFFFTFKTIKDAIIMNYYLGSFPIQTTTSTTTNDKLKERIHHSFFFGPQWLQTAFFYNDFFLAFILTKNKYNRIECESMNEIIDVRKEN